MKKPQLRLFSFAVILCLLCAIAVAQTAPTTAPAGGTAAPAAKSGGKSAGTSGATDAQIAAAKASHQVWVNLDSGKYHKGGRWYGKTKNGKFLSEADAKAAGYKPAGRD